MDLGKALRDTAIRRRKSCKRPFGAFGEPNTALNTRPKKRVKRSKRTQKKSKRKELLTSAGLVLTSSGSETEDAPDETPWESSRQPSPPTDNLNAASPALLDLCKPRRRKPPITSESSVAGNSAANPASNPCPRASHNIPTRSKRNFTRNARSRPLDLTERSSTAARQPSKRKLRRRIAKPAAASPESLDQLSSDEEPVLTDSDDDEPSDRSSHGSSSSDRAAPQSSQRPRRHQAAFAARLSLGGKSGTRRSVPVRKVPDRARRPNHSRGRNRLAGPGERPSGSRSRSRTPARLYQRQQRARQVRLSTSPGGSNWVNRHQLNGHSGGEVDRQTQDLIRHLQQQDRKEQEARERKAKRDHDVALRMQEETYTADADADAAMARELEAQFALEAAAVVISPTPAPRPRRRRGRPASPDYVNFMSDPSGVMARISELFGRRYRGGARGGRGRRGPRAANVNFPDIDNMSYEQLQQMFPHKGANETPAKNIHLLPTHKLKQKMKDDNKCVICLEEYEVGDEVKRLPCLHCFHTECIDPALKLKNECPICRQRVDD